MSESDIISDMDKDDESQFRNDFPNANYIGIKSENTVIHIMSFFANRVNEYLPRIIEIIKYNPKIINSINSRKRTFLHEAFKYKNYKLIEHIVDNYEIDLYIKDDKSLTLFSWACTRGQLNIITKLIEKGSPYDHEDIGLISDDSLREKVGEILFGNKNIKYDSSLDEDLSEDNSFKIYKEDDFIFDQKQTIGEGTYGVAIVVVDKTTGKKCVVKKFTKLKAGKYLYDDQAIRDITFLRTLKKRKNTVQIYGVFIDKKNRLYIVMEFLERELSYQLNLIRNVKNTIKKREYYKYLLYELLLCVDGNSKSGIIHCDTKANNIMINKFGVAKYIDFGFSYYNGISPYISNIKKRIHEGFYLSQDGYPEDTDISYYDSNKNLLFKVKHGFIGYNIDIPSVAMIFIHKVATYDIRACFSHNGMLYFNPTHINENEILVESDQSNVNKLKLEYGDDLFNFLMKFLEVDPNIRPTAKELLTDSFFGGKIIEYPKDLELTNLSFNESSNDNTTDMIIRKSLKSYNSITSNNYIRTGFVYFDDILKNYSNDTLRIVRRDEKYHDNLKGLLHFSNMVNICQDALFNAIIYINENLVNGYFTETELKDHGNTIMLIIFLYFSKIYSDVYVSVNDLFKYTINIDNSVVGKIKKISEMMLRDENFYKNKPMLLYIGYIKFILQVVLKDSVKIETLIFNLLSRIIKILTDKDEKFPEGEYNIFEFVKYVYNSIPDKFDIGLQSTITF